jgi:hypothetical protein
MDGSVNSSPALDAFRAYRGTLGKRLSFDDGTEPVSIPEVENDVVLNLRSSISFSPSTISQQQQQQHITMTPVTTTTTTLSPLSPDSTLHITTSPQVPSRHIVGNPHFTSVVPTTALSPPSTAVNNVNHLKHRASTTSSSNSSVIHVTPIVNNMTVSSSFHCGNNPTTTIGDSSNTQHAITSGATTTTSTTPNNDNNIGASQNPLLSRLCLTLSDDGDGIPHSFENNRPVDGSSDYNEPLMRIECPCGCGSFLYENPPHRK